MIKNQTTVLKIKNDPLEEDRYAPCRSITHKYENRALFLVTLKCHTYCDFCTRERKVNKNSYKTYFEEGLDYIKSHPEINDVILSGGDPLTLKNKDIDYILKSLRKINHVKVIRIHSKICSHFPKRINDELLTILSKNEPLYFNAHISDLSEFHNDCKRALIKLRKAGLIMGSQSVLQRGVNDSVEHLKELFNGLVEIGVKPYYLYQMDKTDKYDKYIVEEDKAIKIVKKLRESISGMAVPRLILDTKKYKQILM